jgi:hypothetical protein
MPKWKEYSHGPSKRQEVRNVQIYIAGGNVTAVLR